MRILAVDDDPVILEFLAEALSVDQGHHLDMHPTAESGLDALNATKQPFDCILLDIMLPGMDGIEMCKHLRKLKHHSKTPILMITGSQEVNLMARAFEAGATDFITKPLNHLELATRVKSATLLNQSLVNAQHTMNELTQLTKIRFEEPLALKVHGISEVLAFENELLRNRAGCFAMTMFTLDIYGLRGIYRKVNALTYRNCVEAIGSAAMVSLKNHNAKLAYIGSGRFIGAIMERVRMDPEVMTDVINTDLVNCWAENNVGVPVPPTVQIANISAQRLWSSVSASNGVREFLSNFNGMDVLTLREEDDLFSRLNNKLMQPN